MAYVFLSDGGPEAEEYESNYFYFDESNSETLARLEAVLVSSDTLDPKVRAQIHSICRASLHSNVYNMLVTSRLRGMLMEDKREVDKLLAVFELVHGDVICPPEKNQPWSCSCMTNTLARKDSSYSIRTRKAAGTMR